MLSLKLLSKLLTLPIVILRTCVEYYTVGTIYSRTNSQFNTLYKNIHFSVENHLANNFQLLDIPKIIYHPMTELITKYKSSPMVTSGALKGYGERFNEHSFWFHKNPEAKNVLVYYHGGGYALNCFDAQFVGFMALFYALPKETRENTSLLIVDYTLTFMEGGRFPRQIYEALEIYAQLLDDGFTKIHLLGDSAGGNLELAVLRFLSYPEDRKYFDQFKDYDFKQFDAIKTQPESCILISPWVQPLHITTNRTNIDNTGDLGARSTVMGDWYIGDLPQDKALSEWVTFSKIDADKFSKIDLFKNGKTIAVYGSREVLFDGIEDFLEKINSFGNVKTYIEPGGVHVGMLYVESLDFLGSGGIKAVNGEFEGKFSYKIVSEFLSSVIN